jgi:hypothetical protein
MLEFFRKLKAGEKVGLGILAVIFGPKVLSMANSLVVAVVTIILVILIISFCLIMALIQG